MKILMVIKSVNAEYVLINENNENYKIKYDSIEVQD